MKLELLSLPPIAHENLLSPMPSRYNREGTLSSYQNPDSTYIWAFISPSFSENVYYYIIT